MSPSQVETSTVAEPGTTTLRLIADNLPVIVAHVTRDGRYLFVNKPYSARFGLEPDALVGRTLESVVGTDGFAALRPFVERVLNGEHLVFEIEIPYPTLGRRIMRSHYAPVIDAAGTVNSFVATVLDVTDLRRAEQALHEHESHFRSAFELSAVGQAMVAADGTYLLVNDRY